jgi:hypothetical protein
VAIKSLLKTLTVNNGAILVPHLEAYQRAGKFPEKWMIEINNYKTKDDLYHPSSHCFMPPIELWRYRKGQGGSFPISPALRRTFDVGHMWHGYIQEMLIDMRFVEKENVERPIIKEISGAYGNAGAKGTVDLMNVEIPSAGTWLVDIKTMRKDEFESGANPFTFKKWEAQVSIYMDWLNLDKAMILSVCKDSPHGFREYIVNKNEALVQEIYDRWTYVEYCLREGLVPEDNYKPDPMLLNPGDSALDVVVANEISAQ